MTYPYSKTLVPALLGLTLRLIFPGHAMAQTEPARSSWLRSPIDGSYFVRDVDSQGHVLTCERRMDGTQRCVALAAPRLRGARAMIGVGSYLALLGGTLLLVGSIIPLAGCESDECANANAVLGAGAFLAGTGIPLLAWGAVRAHRFHHAARTLRLLPFVAMPLESGRGPGAERTIPRSRFPVGLAFTLRF